jgi:hypothetical protein
MIRLCFVVDINRPENIRRVYVMILLALIGVVNSKKPGQQAMVSTIAYR